MSPVLVRVRLTRTSSVLPSTRVSRASSPAAQSGEASTPASNRARGVTFIMFPHSLSSAIRRFASIWPSLGPNHPRAERLRHHLTIWVTSPIRGGRADKPFKCDKNSRLTHQGSTQVRAPFPSLTLPSWPAPLTVSHKKPRHGAGVMRRAWASARDKAQASARSARAGWALPGTRR
ncbi:hypothetical protein D3C78_1302430 [compost metagenome]